MGQIAYRSDEVIPEEHVTSPAIFDGHNDVVLRLWRGGPDAVASFGCSEAGHIDRARARKGGFAGGFFALFVPGQTRFDMAPLRHPPYSIPMPPPLARDAAQAAICEQMGIVQGLAQRGELAICLSAGDIETAMAAGQIAALLHIEGAEAIGETLEELDGLYARGLRSLGPVWSRSNVFGHGVPFRFPSDGDIGSGLTETGRRLARAVADRNMIFDTSHLNTKGFFDVAEMGLPMVATHSNAHAVSPHSRNLTDAQLKAIGDTGGMVGLNFATAFLRGDGRMQASGAFEFVLRHLDHMIEVAGEDHVGFGSDFDGAIIPEEIGSVAGLPVVVDAMRHAGYGTELIDKICHGNWIAAIRRIIG